ncbi:TrkH family potassium uptake protein [Natrialba asiatica]|uniref:Cation transporter n=1 Tax=Natrialba asiatica (strain ATCC 700177 / DSM 12278 / JCM 9576 / FERM P-10747 / NBRC 102637 / 172P1) TaxID=29540 RepID=M0AQ84_NATA1|nr:TrkH family potassium uptake protein [Natrialba asiatica]ELZ00487.1 cation transporter [Natrialba asiatica DSM 12278]
MGLRVEYGISVSLVGTVLKYMTIPLLAPLVTALIYGERVLPFAITIVIAIVAGTLLERLHPEPKLGHREGFLFVALTWLAVPILGMIPYLVAGQGTIGHPVDALFESMSGFTTTGATVLADISFETHSRSVLLWRQFTQWLGGLGIIVLMVAILPQLSVGGAQVMEEEAPGFSIEKLTPGIQETARALWKIYIGFTVLAIALYYGWNLAGFAPEMTFYNAVAHAITTMPTGGFSPEARSIEAFSPVIQWTIMPFMLIAGTNFALFWYAFHGKPGRLVENTEFRSYVSTVTVAGGVLFLLLVTGAGVTEVAVPVGSLTGEFESAARHALFQSLSFITTTGYASLDFNAWSPATQTVLLFMMFFGGSVGSAAGSIKIIRWYVIQRFVRRELYTTVHPDAVVPIRTSTEVLDEETIRGLLAFTFLFLVLFAVSTVLLYFDSLRAGPSLSTLEAMSTTMATLGNIGPGFGTVGPMNNYLPFSNTAKLYMVFLMWIGRLEILSVLIILTPTYWWQ